jgi:hypothetical protein
LLGLDWPHTVVCLDKPCSTQLLPTLSCAWPNRAPRLPPTQSCACPNHDTYTVVHLAKLCPRMFSSVCIVSSISLPLRPKGRNGLVTAPWSGAPNQSMVGGPPSHSAIKSGWGPRLVVRGSPRRRTHPTLQTLTDPREHWSGGKLRHHRRRGPLPGSDAPGATARCSTASYVIPSSPSRHCIPCVKPRPPL